MITYNPLWKTLIDKSMNRGQLAKAVGLARTTVTKMGKNEPISMNVIERICRTLDVRIEDVVEIIPEQSAPAEPTHTKSCSGYS